MATAIIPIIQAKASQAEFASGVPTNQDDSLTDF